MYYDKPWTHFISVGDGSDLEVDVELASEDLPLLHQHPHQACAYYSGANQPHAHRLCAGRSEKIRPSVIAYVV